MHVEYLRSTCILLENQVLAAKLWMFLYLQNLAAKITSQQLIFDGFLTLSGYIERFKTDTQSVLEKLERTYSI